MEIPLERHLGCLREWRDSDAPALVRYANNRNIWVNLRDGFPFPYSNEDATRFISMARSHQPPRLLAIDAGPSTADAGPGSGAVGGIGLSLYADVERVSAEMGYWIAEPFWGRGIATAAIRAMTGYAFATFGLTRVFAVPFGSNAASARALEKAGFHLEGRMRRSAIKDGHVVDQLLYAVTDEDWRDIAAAEKRA